MAFTAKFVTRCAFCKLRRIFVFLFSNNHLRKHMFYCDCCISIQFVCFCFKVFCLWSTFSGKNRPVFFEDFSYLSYYCPLLVNKAMSASHHRDLLRYSWAVQSHPQEMFLRTKLGECVALWFALNLPALKWLTEQKAHSKFANTQCDTTSLVVNRII